MSRRGEHAVVVGASIGGMLAARVLSDAYEQVTVIDRDELPEGNEPRRAVPQGRQPHALIIRGQQVFEELLPGIRDEMIDDGAATFLTGFFRTSTASVEESPLKREHGMTPM